jgi:S1-C subfamily serine protease
VLSLGRSRRGALVASWGLVNSLPPPIRLRRGAALEGVIRTHVALYPGFSGGPLINLDGEVVGVATAGLVRGTALAIPSALAWARAETLAQHGRIRRAYLGVSMLPVHVPPPQRSGKSQEIGLLVTGVSPDGPAAQAGLLVGDLLLEFDGRPLSDPEDLMDALDESRIGRPAPATLVRGGQLQTVSVTAGERPARHG